MVRMLEARYIRAGALGLLAAALPLAGCSSQEDEPISSATSRYEVAEQEPAGQPAASAEPQPAPEAASAAAAGGPAAQPAGEAAARPAAQPPAVSEDELEGLAPPEGAPAELAAHLDKLNGSLRQLGLPQSLNSMALQAWFGQAAPILRAKRATADRILAADQLEPELRRRAVRAKLEAMGGLLMSGDEQIASQLKQFAEQIADESDEELAGMANLALAELRIASLRGGQEVPAGVAQDLANLLATGAKTAGEFDFLNLYLVSASLLREGLFDTAVAVLLAVGQGFEHHADAGVASNAGDLIHQTRALDFQVQLLGVMQGKPEATQALVAAAERLLEQADAGALGLISQAAMNVEFSGDMETAGKLYELLRQSFANHERAELTEYLNRLLAGYHRRAGLLGKPLVIEGVTADGQPLDWSLYQGKVVLIDFWATWCGPCLAELPNLEANYQRYHDQGFEILGVNLDDEQAAAERFLAERKLPWTTVFSNDPNAVGFNNPNAVKCGVEAIPFLVLLDREGKVAALHVRGEQLGAKLAELLGGEGEAAEAQPPAQQTPPADQTPPPNPN